MLIRKTIYKRKGRKKKNNRNVPDLSFVKNRNNNLLMHKRNVHRSTFTNFEELASKFNYINLFLKKNEKGKLFYNFQHSLATYFLSKALLKQYYDIEFYLPYVYKIHNLIDFFFFCDEEKNVYDKVHMQTEEGREKRGNQEMENEKVEEEEKEQGEKKKMEQLKKKILVLYKKHNDELNLLLYKPIVSNKFEDSSCQPDMKTDFSKHEESFLELLEKEEERFICPCIPGRVNYIHLLSDLAIYNERIVNVEPSSNESKHIILSGNAVKLLDIGVGANCIYPLLGCNIYDWRFVGSDINLESLKIAYLNILMNNQENNIKLKFQKEKDKIFFHIIDNKDLFFFSMCNPPFYSEINEFNKHPRRHIDAKISEVLYSEEKNYDACADARKEKILKKKNHCQNEYNNGCDYIEDGNKNDDGDKDEIEEKEKEELTDHKLLIPNETNVSSLNMGGEYSFILKMINESTYFFYNIIWFSSLVSKFKNVKLLKQEIIKSMILYKAHGNEQINFLNSLINKNIHFDNSFYFKNVNIITFPIFISQYRILQSYQGKITRWIVCWSYYNEEQIKFLKNLYYQKCQAK